MGHQHLILSSQQRIRGVGKSAALHSRRIFGTDIIVNALGDNTTMLVRFLNKSQNTPVSVNNIWFSYFDWAPSPNYRKKAQIIWFNDETGELIGSPTVIDLGDSSSYSTSFTTNLSISLTTHIVGLIKTYQEREQ